MNHRTETAENYAKFQSALTELAERAADLKRTLKEGRIYELTANGERVLVRPVMVEQPRAGGERDPWFGLSYADWRKFRLEGFDGWMETTEGSNQPKVMILVEKAAAWFEARCRKQAEKRAQNGGMSEHSIRMRERRKHRSNKKDPVP